ncbi:unnamed protein product [Chironomus riparius]|uniref:Peptidase S1 domain-containing protein n=1 Tax=Chironomus riparius TaxID=315576 RepID=A0A9N9RNK1_9DIPT|nr:unnamed protein product [Chironomus riparius]
MDLKIVPLSLSLFCAFISSEASLYNLAAVDLGLGSNCTLRNNEEGYCEQYTKCEYAQLMYDIQKTSEIKFCTTGGVQSLVCCPKKDQTSFPLVSNKLVREKPSKFQKALCNDDQIVYNIDNQIDKGVNAEIGEFPFQAAIGYKSEGGEDLDFYCGGSLIADDIVLTAANCVSRRHRVPIMVRLGRTSIDLDNFHDNSTAQDISIETIKIHPKYTRRSHQNDIAIIKLKAPYMPSNSIKPICISTKEASLPKDFMITGFGRVNQFAKKRSNWLLKGKVNEYPIEKCKEKLSNTAGIQIIDSQFCGVSNTGVDVCRGEPGSPLIFKQNNYFHLQAITSFGMACGTTYPTIYTRVSKFLEWIEEEMDSLE